MINKEIYNWSQTLNINWSNWNDIDCLIRSKDIVDNNGNIIFL